MKKFIVLIIIANLAFVGKYFYEKNHHTLKLL